MAKQTRLDKWENSESVRIGVLEHEGPVHDLANEIYDGTDNEDDSEDEPNLLEELIDSTHEIIFKVDEGEPSLHLVAYMLDPDEIKLHFTPILEISKIDENEILFWLALARGKEIPVFPNTEKEKPKLAKLHRKLLTDGFKDPFSDEDNRKFQLTKKPDINVKGKEILKSLSTTEFITPAEIHLIREQVEKDFKRFTRAEKLLADLEYAITQLEDSLSSKKRNESELQEHLTENPILFGLNYQLIKPKHQLGKEYEMDYALIRWDGTPDLVEIEASTHKLFKKDDDPTAALTHAEQQVLDWLHWLEKNHAYARESLPGITQPKGFVVMGTNEHLSDKQREKLKFRNRIHGNKLIILTYNDLLERAKNMHEILEKSSDN